jgi:hypothetical protein
MAGDVLGDATGEIAALETELVCSSATYEEGEKRRSRIGSAAYTP